MGYRMLGIHHVAHPGQCSILGIHVLGLGPRHGVHYQDTSTGAASVVPLVRVVDSCTVLGVCPPIRQHINAFLPRSACTISPSPLDDMAMRGHERRPGDTDYVAP